MFAVDPVQTHPSIVKPSSPSFRLGPVRVMKLPPQSNNSNEHRRVNHFESHPMLSLEDVAPTKENIQKFVNQRTHSLKVHFHQNPDEKQAVPNNVSFFGEPKLDGVSLAVRYGPDGKVQLASTRGDGRVGENVTQTALSMIANMVRKLEDPGTHTSFEVRGEVCVRREDLLTLNKWRLKNHKIPFSSTRHAASGLLRILDASESHHLPQQMKQPLMFLPYSIIAPVSSSFSHQLGEAKTSLCRTQSDVHQLLKKWGFNSLGDTARLSDATSLLDYYKTMAAKRDTFEFECDGVVIKVNTLEHQRVMGYTARSPKWAVALKFPSKKYATIVEKIEVQIGQKGQLTPVAHVGPIDVDNTRVSRATLHNFHRLSELDVRVGDTVTLQRGGSVIPQIVGVDLSRRPEWAVPSNLPTTCPSCGCAVEEYKRSLRCPNKATCGTQQIQKIIKLASRQCLDIPVLGPNKIRELFEAGELAFPEDIFTLHKRPELANRNGWGKKSCEKLFKAISERRTIPLNKFILAQGIDRVGSQAADRLAKHFKTYDHFLECLLSYSHERPQSGTQILKEGVFGVGNMTIVALGEFASHPRSMETLQRLGGYSQNSKNLRPNPDTPETTPYLKVQPYE
eukprot:GHVN01052776.1.p1 GENE.GHVN01052776.1~~GHVN01052776.1.p1  ORF type:complete len:622 (-),score=76.26 GHVN01052776.1:1508-3373(-)